MHIPDGFLSAPVWASLDLLSLPMLGWVVRRVRPAAELSLPAPPAPQKTLAAEFTMHDRDIPLMGVMGAFVFAAQMLNFPMGPGVSAHMLGGALLGAVLGLGPAMVVMSAVVILQALVFQDGGVLALGANLVNMAILGVLLGAAPRFLLGRTRIALFLGGFLSVAATACLAVGELWMSGITIPAPLLWWLAGVFVFSGIAEGVLTVTVAQGIDRLQPGRHGLGVGTHAQYASPRTIAVGAAALLLGMIALLFATSAPDSLEALATQLELAPAAHWFDMSISPLAGYETAGIDLAWMRKASAGFLGVVLAAGFSLGGARLIRRRRERETGLPG